MPKSMRRGRVNEPHYRITGLYPLYFPSPLAQGARPPLAALQLLCKAAARAIDRDVDRHCCTAFPPLISGFKDRLKLRVQRCAR